MYGKESFLNKVDFKTGKLSKFGRNNKVYLRDIKNMFQDKQETNNRLRENPIIYETFYPDIEANELYIFYGITKIYPGRIGREFFMTKGHVHKQKKMCETYTCLSGRGMLLEQINRKIQKSLMEPGTIAYIGENSFHRVYNIGDEPCIFMASCRADYEHDYSLLKEKGFLSTVTVDDL